MVENVIPYLTTDHAMLMYLAQLTVLWVLGVTSLLVLQHAEMDSRFVDEQL